MRKNKANGIAVMLALLSLILLASGLVLGINWRGKIIAHKKQTTMLALAEAKAAIIAWSTLSATHQSAPGMLPCPLDYNELANPSKIGESRPSCVNNAVLLGLLPWRTLKLPELRDGNGDLLWYVLSPGFRYPPINSNSRGKLSLDDKDDIVALIISPGVARLGQNRKSPNLIPEVNNYLEGLNASGGLNYSIQANDSNDIILAITASELFSKVHQRVANEVANELWMYFCGTNNVKINGGCINLSLSTAKKYFPFAAEFNDSSCLGTGEVEFANNRCQSTPYVLAGRIPASNDWRNGSLLREITSDSGAAWFQENGWRELVYYAVSESCTNGGNCSSPNLQTNYPDKLPAKINNQDKFVIVLANRSLNTQVRISEFNKLNESNYYESFAISGNKRSFTMRENTASENDLIYGFR